MNWIIIKIAFLNKSQFTLYLMAMNGIQQNLEDC
jgi:hypothetical protein